MINNLTQQLNPLADHSVIVEAPSIWELEGVHSELIFRCTDCSEEFYYDAPLACDECGCTCFEEVL